MSAILVIGEPGTGKTRAAKNLDPGKTVIIKPNNKPLPFPGWKKMYSGSNMFTLKTFGAVRNLIMGIDPTTKKKTGKGINDAKHITTVIIEDFTHYISKNVMDNSKVKGYDKWTELAVLVFNNIIELESEIRPDLNLVLIAHAAATSDASNNSEVGLQTAGKLMDNALKIPSYFTYVFHALVDYTEDKPKYLFQTNRDSLRLAKSPELMFPLFIENDYKYIFERIHKYDNGLIDFDAENKNAEQVSAKPKDVEKPEDKVDETAPLPEQE